ncbi:MAG: GNAT family N-acetyltransferase [Flavobacteriales bacterium]|nr:GNAT family N-acetyltransferase [Flavobacteriales bacterium]MBP7449507.1 GNAT family N-acetyltransferase [Flavobacteriales bacterium]
MLTIDLPIFPVLTTERLVLRELRPSDAEQVLAMRSDPEVMQHVNRPLAHTMDDALALIDLIHGRGAAGESVQWAITVKENDGFIGLIGFWRIVKEHHLAELGYTLARAHWGKGFASEAIAATLEFGFGTIGLHRVEAITRPRNTASVRALVKNGFVQEGHFKEDIFWNGEFHDSLHFGRLVR